MTFASANIPLHLSVDESPCSITISLEWVSLIVSFTYVTVLKMAGPISLAVVP